MAKLANMAKNSIIISRPIDQKRQKPPKFSKMIKSAKNKYQWLLAKIFSGFLNIICHSVLLCSIEYSAGVFQQYF